MNNRGDDEQMNSNNSDEQRLMSSGTAELM